jgi:glycosyltransferase involved in cell wall biosynthesis
MRELSLIIPGRNEMFMARTVQDALDNIEADTEIIAVIDGEADGPPVPWDDRVKVIRLHEAVGQRAATNVGVKLSRAKYVMKVDAHCSFDKGFDRKMLDAFKEVGDNVTMVPTMRNLWAFDWKCFHCGWKKYQGPTPEKCEDCGKDDKIRRKMLWKGKERPQSNSYCFDSAPHFQYFREYNKRPEGKGEITESMSLQGSAFMATREKYWELKLSEEELGNWGNQGIEVACKTWLSGGRVLVNKRTWYAHMFRTQGGDFSFPWQNKGRDVSRTKKAVWEQLTSGKWDKQVRPMSWLVERFWPVPGWTDEDLDKLKQQERENRKGSD